MSQMEGEVEELNVFIGNVCSLFLRTLNGKHGDKELSIKDFTDNAKSAITSRGLPLSDQANFILSYQEVPANEEMKLYPKSDLKNGDRVFDLL